MYREAVFFSVLLLLTPVDNRKFKIGGGGSNRGSSAARGSSSGGYQQGGGQPAGGYHPNQPAGGYHPNQPVGGYHPNQPAGGYHPNQPVGGYHPNQPAGGYHPGGYYPGAGSGFHSDVGPGSVSRSSGLKTALAAGALGAVGGIVTYELGKAIINSASTPFHANGNNYYFGEKNYKGDKNTIMCSMPLEELIKQTQASTTTAAPTTTTSGEPGATTVAPPSTTLSPDQVLANLQFKDGTRPKTINWGCKKGIEVCCGTDCCPAPVTTSGGSSNGGNTSLAGIVFGILVALLLLICCCCCVAYTFFRSAFDSCLPRSQNTNEGSTVYTNATKFDDSSQNYGGYGQPQQQQGYPMQTYPTMQQGGYPPTQGYTYPSQPPAFQQYPQQPYSNQQY